MFVSMVTIHCSIRYIIISEVTQTLCCVLWSVKWCSETKEAICCTELTLYVFCAREDNASYKLLTLQLTVTITVTVIPYP
jgi:hypothetical protein